MLAGHQAGFWGHVEIGILGGEALKAGRKRMWPTKGLVAPEETLSSVTGARGQQKRKRVASRDLDSIGASA